MPRFNQTSSRTTLQQFEEEKNSLVYTNICKLVRYHKKNEMGGACGAYEGGESCAQGSGGENCGKETIGGDPHVDGRIILRWIFRKWEWVVGTGWSWLRIGRGTCEYGNELSCSIKYGELLD
jgi:hypothetical protein